LLQSCPWCRCSPCCSSRRDGLQKSFWILDISRLVSTWWMCFSFCEQGCHLGDHDVFSCSPRKLQSGKPQINHNIVAAPFQKKKYTTTL
jgi:hypothetical protein